MSQSGWFAAHYQVMLDIGALVLAPMLGMATIGAILRQDFRRLGRVWAVCLPVAAVGGLAAVEVTAKALVLTDQLSRAVTGGVGASLSASLHNVAKVISQERSCVQRPGFCRGTGRPAGGRRRHVDLARVGPAGSGDLCGARLRAAGPGRAGVAGHERLGKRLVETLLALILAKFVIVTVLSLAVGAIGSGAGIDSIVTGGALLLLAAGAPFRRPPARPHRRSRGRCPSRRAVAPAGGESPVAAQPPGGPADRRRAPRRRRFGIDGFPGGPDGAAERGRGAPGGQLEGAEAAMAAEASAARAGRDPTFPSVGGEWRRPSEATARQDTGSPSRLGAAVDGLDGDIDG